MILSNTKNLSVMQIITKLTCSIFTSSKIHQQNLPQNFAQERVKDIKVFLKNKKKKSDNMVVNDIKTL